MFIITLNPYNYVWYKVDGENKHFWMGEYIKQGYNVNW